MTEDLNVATETDVEKAQEPQAPETMEERMETMEIAIRQLAQDISHDIRSIAEQVGSQGRIVAGVYSMSMAAQVLAEATAHYIAGYKAGDFEKQVDAAIEANDPNGIGIEAKVDSFDAELFLSLVRESAAAFVKIREAEVAKRRAEREKESSKIVTLPEKKIILP